MSRHNRWPGSGGSYDTEGNHRGRYQSTCQPGHHQSRHDRPGSSSSARNTWNSPNSLWNREQLQTESSDINIRQQTDGPCYDQHCGGNEWPFSHREEGFQDPCFMSPQSSSAYAPTCDYVVPMTASLLTTPSSSRILETSSITPEITSYPQPKVEKQTSPSPEYLEATLEPSTYLYDHTSSRKLLILDLNGTLVFRSPHQRKSGTNGQISSHHHHHDSYRSEHPRISSERGEPHFKAHADLTVLPRLRPVHPRPFLPSFRQYLFHPKTRLWLDTMIWSSAQPHSVSDMVQRCFGDSKDELVAVWARDTLGLSKEQYHRKTQTTKDLEKPWAFLSSPKSSEEPKDSAPASSPLPNLPRTVHSAHTTLLLDDSPLKAHLQPWNHICIKEYVAEMRSLDVAAAQTMDKTNGASTYGVTEGNVNRSAASQAKSDDGVGAETTSEDQPEEQQDSRKRKRKLKKIAKKENKMMLKRQNVSGENPIEWRDGELTPKQWWRMYDCTLLAVIGVLDAVKRESNVAAWVRKRGLRRTIEEEERDDMSQMANFKEKGEITDFDSDASTDCATSPPETEKDNGGSKRPRRVSAGNSEGLSGNPTKEGLWFEDELTMSYWVERGIGSLKELHIEVDAGVKVS
ncbi:hypothetical protein M378DRAFT_169051 [Amanita muscaria Koide BX008]|uniref:FCP1 homology domain-containing protein n=1 Tax=Amanita muscaria (strain Koide BX008) TaxID=946122 RepID=A0A0C2SA28_AMAMK|nr:hypothetical protein M378DRAFT_169051 [Amanita muscaria Koide BX008]